MVLQARERHRAKVKEEKDKVYKAQGGKKGGLLKGCGGGGNSQTSKFNQKPNKHEAAAQAKSKM